MLVNRGRAFSVVLLILSLQGLLVLAHRILPVMASGPIYIRADGSIDPSTALIQRDGDTYTLEGNVTSDEDGIVIQIDNIVLDGAGYSLQGISRKYIPPLWGSRGVLLSGRTNVTIKNVAVTGFSHGIWLDSSSCNNSILENNITSNFAVQPPLPEWGYGVYLESSDSNTIADNNIVYNPYGVVLATSSSNNIARNRLVGLGYPYGWGYGISLENSTSNSIIENEIAEYIYGVKLSESRNNNMIDNNVTTNSKCGMLIEASMNSTVVGNDMTNNGQERPAHEGPKDMGLEISDSTYCNVLENTYANNGLSLSCVLDCKVSDNTFTNKGFLLLGSYGNLVENNTVNHRPILYLEGMSDLSVNDAGQVILVSCDNIRIEELNLSNLATAVQLIGTNNSRIANNNITQNALAVFIDSDSSNCSVTRNNITNNGDGISLSGCYSVINENSIANNGNGILLGGRHHSVVGNNVTVNGDNGIMVGASFCNITGNHIAYNKDGIHVGSFSAFTTSGSHNTICSNNVTANSKCGIRLWSSPDDSSVFPDYPSSDNVVVGNNIVSNGYCVGLGFSLNNCVYHNSFVENTQLAYVIGPSNLNIWDNGYPSGGNYWSDYVGVDIRSGFSQNETGCDGIGDTRYDIKENNQDRYPLMFPLTTYSVGTWNASPCNVDIASNSTVSCFQVNTSQKTISFNVTGGEGTAGFCRITIPNTVVQDLWQGSYTILLNGNPWPFTNWTDATSTYVYLNYTHSEHGIVIIPEFPSPIVLQMFVMAILFAVSVCRRKRMSYVEDNPAQAKVPKTLLAMEATP